MNPVLTKADFPDNFDEPFKPAVTSSRCPKCKSSDLLFIEITELSTTWIVKDGRLNRQAGYHEPGDVRHVEGRCSKCDHTWKFRKAHQITDLVTELDPGTFEPLI